MQIVMQAEMRIPTYLLPEASASVSLRDRPALLLGYKEERTS